MNEARVPALVQPNRAQPLSLPRPLLATVDRHRRERLVGPTTEDQTDTARRRGQLAQMRVEHGRDRHDARTRLRLRRDPASQLIPRRP